MRLDALGLQNFRSFTNFTAQLAEKNVVIGPNGSGKSSLIEAVRLLSVGKSFRTNRLDEAVRFDQPFFRLSAKLKGDSIKSAELFYGQAFAEQPIRDRVLSVDGKERGVMDFVGVLPSVMFVPSDVEIVMGGPSGRRRYLDGILWQQDPEFREQYLRLGKILKERSASLFLVKVNRAGRDELQPWNELLVAVTKFIRERRQNYLNYAEGELQAKEYRLLGFQAGLSYQAASDSLDAVVEQEIKTAQNLFGPHRDEVEINLNDRSARRYASRGQARTIVMLLKIIEAKFLASRLSTDPIILLDDILSELDETNGQFLINHLPEKSQIITTSIQAQDLFEGWQEVKLP